MIPAPLQDEIKALIERQDAEALENFLIDHFKEFPAEVQGQLLTALVEESIDRQAGERAIEKLQQEGLEAMQKISVLKAIVELQKPSDEA